MIFGDMNSASASPELESHAERLSVCQEQIGYRFRDPNLLLTALTHASGSTTRVQSNERLEFLGDAVLGLVVCEWLFKNYPEYLEGELTKIKSDVVSRKTCAKLSRKIGIEQFLIVGKGLSSQHGVPRSLLSDVFEALVAAIYLDGGLDETRIWLLRWIEPEIQNAIGGHLGFNYKSLLQQMTQRDWGSAPMYVLTNERGPDHSKHFQVAVQIGSRQFGPAWGRSKKEAEQRAAGNAIAELRGEEPPYRAE